MVRDENNRIRPAEPQSDRVAPRADRESIAQRNADAAQTQLLRNGRMRARLGQLQPEMEIPRIELVADLQEFVGAIVTLIVGAQFRLTETARAALQVGSHHVPGDPAASQMIERREAPREQIGRLVGNGNRYAEAQMSRRMRHQRNQGNRIVHRHLRGRAQRRRGAGAEHVIDAGDIAKKQTVEQSPLEHLREFDPVVGVEIADRAVVGRRPLTRREMPDAIHHEGIKADVARHVGAGGCT
ncbi:hypothetical protein A9R05_27830 [Burkholderia sp. KK1]|nr:hypothetical protein A9R05_27830 [Burkholderia sp. KK1]